MDTTDPTISGVTTMPEKKTRAKAHAAKRAGKSGSTQAGAYVHEEIEHVRKGKHGARSAKQAIAIGLSKARRDGVKAPAKKTAKKSTRKKATQDTAASHRKGAAKKASSKRAAASRKALKSASTKSATKSALSRQTRSAARKRPAASKSAAAKKAARTKGAPGRKTAAKAARTRA